VRRLTDMQMSYFILSMILVISDAFNPEDVESTWQGDGQPGVRGIHLGRLSRDAACTAFQGILNQNETGLFIVTLGPQCANLEAPHAGSVAGGYCLASMTGAGWYRSSAVNPLSELVLGIDGSMGGASTISGTNSGGSMFFVRYVSFRASSMEFKWTYPCYLLTEPFKTVCFFHGNFGAISEECDSERMNIFMSATNVAFGAMMPFYGGPLGALSSYVTVYYPFLVDVPIGEDDMSLRNFWEHNGAYNTFLQSSSSWTLAVSLVSPLETTTGFLQGSNSQGLNYGFDSYLSRGLVADKKTEWYGNMSVYYCSSLSANTPSGFVILPFGFSGKSWDAVAGSNIMSPMSTSLKVVGMGLAFVMVKKTMLLNQVVSSRRIPYCERSGCPLMDGGFTDNGPVIPVLSRASEMVEHQRPRHVSQLGPANTMDTIKYLLGNGPLNIWTLSGLNLCPFTQTNLCRIISTIRTLVVPVLPTEIEQSYIAISSNYGIWRPSVQAMYPYCGDPLLFDHFEGSCKSKSICDMWLTVVASGINKIAFLLANQLFVLTMLWLAPTPLASRFVLGFVPQKVINMPYYNNMDSWFPDYVAIAPQKGGFGFTKVAGHALLDYLTLLTVRLLYNLVRMRTTAGLMFLGINPRCEFAVYKMAAVYNTMQQR